MCFVYKMLGPQASYTGNFILFIKALCFISLKIINPRKLVEYTKAKTKVHDLSFWHMFKVRSQLMRYICKHRKNCGFYSYMFNCFNRTSERLPGSPPFQLLLQSSIHMHNEVVGSFLTAKTTTHVCIGD